MMKLLRLTLKAGKLPILVVSGHIKSVFPNGTGSDVWMGDGDRAYVSESMDEIAAMLAAAQAEPLSLLEEAKSELDVALMQSVPEDDQIIIGHVRQASTVLAAAISVAKAGGHS